MGKKKIKSAVKLGKWRGEATSGWLVGLFQRIVESDREDESERNCSKSNLWRGATVVLFSEGAYECVIKV